MHEIAGAALYAMNRFGPAAVEARSAVRCYQEHPQTTPAELGGALLLDARMQTMVGEPDRASAAARRARSEEHTSELQSRQYLVCRLLLDKKKLTTRESNSEDA